VRVEYGSAAPLTEQPDQESPPELERWYEVDEDAGELPWTGAAEAQAGELEQPEEDSPFVTPELLEVQDSEATDVAAWLEDEDEEAEAEAWPAGTSAEAGRAGQGPGPGQVTVGVAELLQLWDTAAALDQRIRQMVRQTLLRRGGLIEPAMASAVPEWEPDREEFTPQLTFCQKARLAATAEDDVQARLIEQLKLPIRGDERAKIVRRVRALVALFEGLDLDQKAKLRGRLNRPDDALARFFDCELSRGFRKRLRALLESPPSPVPPVPVPLPKRQPIRAKPKAPWCDIRRRHLRELFLDHGYEELRDPYPRYFGGIDAVRDSPILSPPTGTRDALKIYHAAEGVSVKLMHPEPTGLLATAKDYLKSLQAFHTNTAGGIRVDGLVKKTLHLLFEFEEGSAGNFTPGTAKALEEIATLAEKSKPKIEFRWFVYLSCRRVESAQFLKDMKLGNLEYAP
jgi:hypothetical protein